MNEFERTKNDLSEFIGNYIENNFKITRTEEEGYRCYRKVDSVTLEELYGCHLQISKIGLLKKLDSVSNHRMFSYAKSILGDGFHDYIDVELNKAWNKLSK